MPGELAQREPVEPGFLPAREAVQLRAPVVPELDIDATRATLTEEDHRHKMRYATIILFALASTCSVVAAQERPRLAVLTDIGEIQTIGSRSFA